MGCRFKWSCVNAEVDGNKRNVEKRPLVDLLVSSLLATGLPIEKEEARQKENATKRAMEKKGRGDISILQRKRAKEGISRRVMEALLGSLGPLWEDMLQWDLNFLMGEYPRFRDHDGLFAMVLQPNIHSLPCICMYIHF